MTWTKYDPQMVEKREPAELSAEFHPDTALYGFHVLAESIKANLREMLRKDGSLPEGKP